MQRVLVKKMAMDKFLFFTAVLVVLIAIANNQDWIVLPAIAILLLSERSLGMMVLTLAVIGFLYLIRGTGSQSLWIPVAIVLLVGLSWAYGKQEPPQELPPEYYLPQGYGGEYGGTQGY